MDTIKQQLSAVFDLLSTIPVSGAHVETMAQVRTGLRQVYGALSQTDPGKGRGEESEAEGFDQKASA